MIRRDLTPKPNNFDALSNAWNNPERFAAELARYYSQLEQDGYRTPTPDRTAPRRTP
ncbi:hypothetical protein GCM10022219_11580 [Microbacterium oryzae]